MTILSVTSNECVKGNSCSNDTCSHRKLEGNEIAERNSTMSVRSTPPNTENDDSSNGFRLKNPYLRLDQEDILYHLALSNKSHDLVEMFGDVKFVCLGGTPNRMEKFAYYILQEIGYKLAPGTVLQDLSAHSHRFSLFKVGPVISVSHGMGVPSISILLHELIKLMYHAGVKDPIFLRLGTCGGVGVKPGSVIVSTEVINGEMKPVHVVSVLGKRIERPTKLNQKLAQEIIDLKDPSDDFQIIPGKTLCTDDFYEAQGRLDGAFCHFTGKDKAEFLNHVRKQGVTNIEMESLALASITHHVGIKSAVICVALLDRLKGDQIHESKKTLEEWQIRPMLMAARYIKKYLREYSEKREMVECKVLTKRSVTCLDCVAVHKRQNGKAADKSKIIHDLYRSNDQRLPKSTSSSSSNSSSSAYNCLPGCSVVVSNSSDLQHVLNESNSVD